jgi:hypothetical protein
LRREKLVVRIEKRRIQETRFRSQNRKERSQDAGFRVKNREERR